MNIDLHVFSNLRTLDMKKKPCLINPREYFCVFNRLNRYDRLSSLRAGTRDYPEYIDHIKCNGSESHINDCTYNIPYTCSMGKYVTYASIYCTGEYFLK